MPAPDPYWSSVSLLLHCDGANASTAFDDRSTVDHAVTANGNAQITTSQSKFGGASMALDGTGDYLSIASSSGFGFGTAAFTLEAWVRLTSSSAVARTIFDFRTSGSDYGNFFMNSALKLTFQVNAAGSVSGPTTLAINTWYHVALTWDGTTMRSYLNGTLEASSANAPSFGASRPCLIGLNYTLSGSSWVGQIDEIRVTKGVARYTSNFTPSTEEFSESDAYTGLIAVPSMLDSVALLSLLYQGRVTVDSMLGTPAALGVYPFAAVATIDSLLQSPAAAAVTDFHDQIAGQPVYCYMDVIDDADVVTRVPISSWQGTLQTGGQCYLRCTIPSPSDTVLDALADAVAFTITMATTTRAGAPVERVIATCELPTLQTDQGGSSYSAQLYGYFDAYPVRPDPDAAFYRPLRGVQSLSILPDSARVRAEVDWIIAPSDYVTNGTITFRASYINFYATEGGQLYMDVGSRPV